MDLATHSSRSRASDLVERYIAKTPTSAQLYRRAVETFPGGVTHDTRLLKPHPLYVARAAGARKWDVDGNEYVDYIGGHGALLLGHNHPLVVEAIQEQLQRGTHFGASHEVELLWAEQIQRMIPCAEKVRFTASGTEATLLALRIARAFTGKRKIVRLAGHFHGWHDHVAFAVTSHFEGPPPAGIVPGVTEQMLVCRPGDAAQLASLLDADDDIAAVIMEPTGATFGLVPLAEGFLAQARALTKAKNVLLIFDEVITGFRVSRGGAQGHYSVLPDLATLAKIVAGGLPGGAVVGRRDVLDVITPRADAAWNLRHRVPHQGTFNANPLTAAAGLATLRIIAETDAIEQANRRGEQLRSRLNEVLQAAGSAWLAYGQFSGFHLFTNPHHRSLRPGDIEAGRVAADELKGNVPTETLHRLRCGLMVGGVDIFPWPGGCVSAVHDDEDIERTAAALAQCLPALET